MLYDGQNTTRIACNKAPIASNHEREERITRPAGHFTKANDAKIGIAIPAKLMPTQSKVDIDDKERCNVRACEIMMETLAINVPVRTNVSDFLFTLTIHATFFLSFITTMQMMLPAISAAEARSNKLKIVPTGSS